MLLLYKCEVEDYSGRKIIATPFQAALGAEDERMWGMMKPHYEGSRVYHDILILRSL